MAEILPPPTEAIEATRDLIKSLGDWYRHQVNSSELDAHTLARLSIVAFTQYAAILAVDTGMDKRILLKICEDNYRMAYKHAPKFRC